MNSVKYLAIAATAAALLSSKTFADPNLTITDSAGDSITIQLASGADNYTPTTVGAVTVDSITTSDISAGNSLANFVGDIGSWGISIDTGSTKGGAIYPVLDVGLEGQAASSGTLTVTWTDDTLSLVAGNSANALLFSQFQNATESVFENGVLLAPSLSTTSGNSTSGSYTLPSNGTTLADSITITGNGATISTDGSVSVPDSGATGLLIGLGICAIGLGAFAKRRKLVGA